MHNVSISAIELLNPTHIQSFETVCISCETLWCLWLSWRAVNAGYGKSRSVDRESDSFEDSDSEDEGSYPKGMSLEKATESLLAWPPIPAHAHPHASVLERRADVILENLKKRTVPVVNLMKPHILVCCQSHWPQHIYYFLKELRKPNFPNPPIVILHPNDPTASQWGMVGIFEDVYFLKGSPLYELDLMRGGVLQAGLQFSMLPPILKVNIC